MHRAHAANERGWELMRLLALYGAFAAAVFVVQGSRPLLGPDHLTYFQLADTIAAACPAGDYWRESDSVRNFAILLAYLHTWTASHVLSMKLVLAVNTVLYLLAAQLFFGLFCRQRWQAVLFALLSAFAVSFGVASWGVTDSTALLPRTLVAPIVMLAMWVWIRFDGSAVKYLVFPLVVAGSLLHLSLFYLAGVLVLVEVWDQVALRPARPARRAAAFAGALLASAALLLWLEHAGVSSKMISIQVPYMMRSLGFDVPNVKAVAVRSCIGKVEATRAGQGVAVAEARGAKVRSPFPGIRAVSVGAPVASPSASAPPRYVVAPSNVGKDSVARSAKEAWAIELSLRPWRNMPMPLVNVANALASSALLLLLGVAGVVSARRSGFTRTDSLMAAMFVVVPLFSLMPQTILWALRSFTPIYPVTIEEVRALSLAMIPALYFILRLFQRILERPGPRRIPKATALVAAVLILPLFMKNLPHWAREGVLSAMTAAGVVNAQSPASVANARSALGLSAMAPLYYATQGVRAWLQANAPRGARILTDRDDMILLRGVVVMGPRQVGATTFYTTPEQAELFLETSKAMASRNLHRVIELGRILGADFIVIPWRAEGDAAFADNDFSVIAMRNG